MAGSRLEEGFIIPPSHLELIVVDHCNLSCRGCNHASPIVAKWYANPDSVHRDFSVLAKVYRPRVVKVLGGEPLLHPDLAEVVLAARSTGISEYFQLTTNGVLLSKMDDAVMEVIDELEISVYPGVKGMDDILALAREKALEFGKKLTVNEYDTFRATLPTLGTEDDDLARKIYATCKIANLWGCHAVRDGYFYECPQRIYIHQLVQEVAGYEDDRIQISDTEDFQARLLAFLDSPDPSSCCRYCLGTVGKQQPHSLIPRNEWRSAVEKPSEEMIDHDWLERSLIKQDKFDDCKIQTRLDPRLDSNTSWWRWLLGIASPRTSGAFAPRRFPAPQRQAAEEARREVMETAKGVEKGGRVRLPRE